MSHHPLLLRDKDLAKLLAMSESELWRRRQNDPDFPHSFRSGPGMRVTEFGAAAAYVAVLKERAAKGLPVPGRRPRGRPRKQTEFLNSA
jgi:predicted DNA-binding transcriptional regulator AlpA